MDNLPVNHTSYNITSKHYYTKRGIYLYSFISSVPPKKIIYPTDKMIKEYNFKDNYGGNF